MEIGDEQRVAQEAQARRARAYQQLEAEFSPEQLKRLEQNWKSDVDLKLDKLLEFADKYQGFLEILIQREKERAELRRAVIDKTLSALIVAAVVGLLSLAWSGLSSELKAGITALKPR